MHMKIGRYRIAVGKLFGLIFLVLALYKYCSRSTVPHVENDVIIKGCPSFTEYSSAPKEYIGESRLPFMRPPPKCRTFQSEAVEKVIEAFKIRLKSNEMATVFENCLPNTLDTTVLWKKSPEETENGEPETIIVTGDIHAEWLRDSAWQLSVYQPLAKHDKELQELIKGAINSQAKMVVSDPYCNAFMPPGTVRKENPSDRVHPEPSDNVFECKYEIDSLASFLALSNEYFKNTGDYSFITSGWLSALGTIFQLLQNESNPTFGKNGLVHRAHYTFNRDTSSGSETLSLDGRGNPLANINLVRSAFRPSDDACILPYFIPGNAFMSVEMGRTSEILTKFVEHAPEDLKELVKRYKDRASEYSTTIKEAIFEHGVVDHPKWGRVLAYEVDGYGGQIIMDDANIPSLLSLPTLGFIDKHDQLYINTRKMILSPEGNPYYIHGRYMEGIGSPHTGLMSVWPLSLLHRIRTSDDDQEISYYLHLVMINTGKLGLMHESVNPHMRNGVAYTRPWFAWVNAEFAKTLIDLAKRKPELIFKEEYGSLALDDLFV